MKNLLFVLFFLGVFLQAQDNSVELRDAANALVSSHNSVAAAYAAIPSPMTQAYRVVLQASYTGANEVFPITFNQKDGADSVKSISVYPAAGVTSLTIGGTPTNTPVILLDGADYVTINGSAGNAAAGSPIHLTVQNLATSGSNSAAIRFVNGATYNRVVNCKVLSNTQLTAGPRTVEYQLSVSNVEGNSYNTLEYSEIVGGRSSIGIAGTAANPNRFIKIANNKIYDFGFAGVWVLSGTSDFTIENNMIYQTQAYNSANSGLNIAIVLGNNIIAGNRIYDLQNTLSTTVRGITVSSSGAGVLRIYNNFISLALDNGTKTSVYALQTAGSGDYRAEIFYNSIYLGGLHTGGTSGNIISAGIVRSNTGDTSSYVAKNNIIVNGRTGGTAGTVNTGAFYSMPVTAGEVSLDFNSYYGSDSAALHAGINGFVYNSITQYRDSAAPHEQNSVFRSVNFVSATDLHLAGSSIGDIQLAGTPIAGITTDIDGDTRSVTTPYKGADEGAVPVPVELTSFAASTDGKDVTLHWTTATEINSKSFVVERKLSGNNWTVSGEVAAAGNSTEIRKYTFADRNVAAGIYSYRLKAVDFDGTFEYSSTIEVSVGTPEAFAVAQNYPNPFNPSTTVEYQLPADAFVTMEIFAVTGEKVATLLNTMVSAGYQKQIIDAAALRLTSGVYMYRISARGADGRDFVQTKKFTLIK